MDDNAGADGTLDLHGLVVLDALQVLRDCLAHHESEYARARVCVCVGGCSP
jgi:hypothetical protein